VSLEERVYRHRCVEAWSMVVPWTGFPLAALVEMAKPLGSAKYLRMETFNDPEMASGQKQFWYPWPYVEGLTMAEATNELAFMVTGAYGKPVAKSMGAPLRCTCRGSTASSRSSRSCASSFVEERPVSFWEELTPERVRLLGERQSRGAASALEPGERDITTNERIPTVLFNGYGDYETAFPWKTSGSSTAPRKENAREEPGSSCRGAWASVARGEQLIGIFVRREEVTNESPPVSNFILSVFVDAEIGSWR
jgi:methionine sulfoxide reductase catalytic subunit